MQKLYSPAQIFLGSYIGGPLSATYLLKKNFDNLGKHNEARNTLASGLLFSAVIVFILPFLPEKTPNSLIPLIYTGVAQGIALQYQLKKNEIKESKIFTFQSNWRVLLITLIGLITFLAIIVLIMFWLEKTGYITL